MDVVAEQERARRALAVLSDAVARLDDRGRIVWANDALCRLTGRDLTGIEGHPWTVLVEPEDAEAARRAVEGAGARGSATVDLRVVGTGGAPLQVECHVLNGYLVLRERAPEDRTEALSHTFVELARANLVQPGGRAPALAKITETAAEALGVQRVGVWLYEEGRTRIREVDLFERPSLRHSSGTLLTYAQCPRYFVSIEHARTLAVDDACRDPRTAGFSKAYFEPNDVMSLLDAPIRVDGQMVGVVCHEQTGARRRWLAEERYFAASIADLTALTLQAHERRQAEQHLKRAEERLRQAQEFETLGRLAGGIAHDFNNVLTAILGYADVLSLRTEDPAGVRDVVRELTEAARRGAALTANLLTFSKRQIVRPDTMDLDSVVRDTAPLVKRLAGSGVCVVTLTRSTRTVRADRGQMERVLMNLATNARDAMPDGGLLVLETADVDVDAQHAARHGVRPGAYAVLSVRDTGVGMDAATMAHLFEPFFSTKPAGVGTGLGLATVSGIVRQGKGFVEAESEPGVGSTFRVYHPALPAAEARPAARVGEGSGRTALFVDDDDTVRALAVPALADAGYVVLEARDGAQAEQVARLWKAPIDALVTDVVLPSLRGPELAKKILATRPGAAVLFISGYPNERAALDLGPRRGFLAKPFTPDALRKSLREALS